MTRTAIFVDAGYFFAHGSVLVSGQRRPRAELSLDIEAAQAALCDLAARRSRRDVLRTYWYDSARGAQITPDQARIAESDGIKLRLGMPGGASEQKSAGPLIVADLVDLARNGSICDAVLLAGDEDIRAGVLLAQGLGVRVHLLGVEPARTSQSHALRMEADTLTEWTRETLDTFLQWEPRPRPADADVPSPAMAIPTPAIGEFVASLRPDEIRLALDHAAIRWGLEPRIDRRLLPRCRAVLDRDLDLEEKKLARKVALDLLRALPERGTRD